MNKEQIITWLMEGDESLRYQVSRDLLGIDKKNLKVLPKAGLMSCYLKSN